MRDLTGESTLAAKKEFEHRCAVRGIKVKHYHADNGRFAEPAFVKECERCGQDLTFCGVGAHHQNGIAERKIKDVTLISRTILLHAMRYWPEYINIMMWPFAAKCAQERMNTLQMNLNLETPDMQFSGTKAVNVQVKHHHTFGCPVYVLDSRLQSNPKGVPKWEPRSRLGIYVGHSPAHAGSVGLVLNPISGLVSHQYHIVYDDMFSTVTHMRGLSVPPNWEQLVKNSSELVTTERVDLTKTWVEGQDNVTADTVSNTPTEAINDPVSNFHGIIEQSQADTAPNEGVEAVPLSTLPNEGASDDTTSNEGASIPQVTQEASQEVSWADESAPYSNTVSEGVEALGMPEMVNLYKSGLRRSPRLAAHKPRRSVLTTLFCFGALLINPIDTYQSTKTAAFTRVRSVAHQFEEANENFDSTCNGILHPVFSAAKEANESYTFKEMAAQDDSDMFILAMEKEIK